MIYRKDRKTGRGNTLAVYRGWYLFGFIPLYVKRINRVTLDHHNEMKGL